MQSAGILEFILLGIVVVPIIITIIDKITFPLQESIATARHRKRKQENAEKHDRECKVAFDEMTDRFAQNEMVNRWSHQISECIISDIRNIMSCSHEAWTKDIQLMWRVEISSGIQLKLDQSGSWEKIRNKVCKFPYVSFTELRLPDLNSQERIALTSVIKEKIGAIVQQKIKSEKLCDIGFIFDVMTATYRSYYRNDSDGYETDEYICYYDCSPCIVFSAKNKAYVEPKAW